MHQSDYNISIGKDNYLFIAYAYIYIYIYIHVLQYTNHVNIFSDIVDFPDKVDAEQFKTESTTG